MKRGFQILTLCLLAISLASCGVYSFTGGSTGDAKSVSISLFPNKAPLVNPSLSQVFSEKLKDQFQKQTRLTLVTTDGDLDFSGYINGYMISPAAIQGNSQVSQNRLTISIHVKYANKLDPKQNFEQDFSNYSDFNASSTLATVENTLVDDITDKLITEIFNRTVNNW